MSVLLTFLLTFLLFVVSSLAQDILTVLSEQKDISLFTTILEQYPGLVQDLNGGQHTVVVPTNNAIQSFNASNPGIILTNSSLQALIQYHVIKDIHPSATFGDSPIFPQTLLSDTNYTNVTGGQRVELSRENNVPCVISAIKTPSNVIQSDILFIGGLIHVVDTVLTIPVSFPATITRAGLSNLVALLNKGGWLSNASQALDAVTNQPDLTIFAPNSPQYGANYNGFNNLTKEQRDQVFENAIVAGVVVYSSMMSNTSNYTTIANLPVVLTNNGTDIWADQSHITARDYLTSNGVLQVLDRPLDPGSSGQRPNLSSSTTMVGSHSHSLSVGAKVGISVGVVIFVILCLLLIMFCLRIRRGRHEAKTDQDHLNEKDSRNITTSPDYSGSKNHNVLTNTSAFATTRNDRVTSPDLQGRPYPSRAPKSSIMELDSKPRLSSPLGVSSRTDTMTTTNSDCTTWQAFFKGHQPQQDRYRYSNECTDNASTITPINLYNNEIRLSQIGLAIASPAVNSSNNPDNQNRIQPMINKDMSPRTNEHNLQFHRPKPTYIPTELPSHSTQVPTLNVKVPNSPLFSAETHAQPRNDFKPPQIPPSPPLSDNESTQNGRTSPSTATIMTDIYGDPALTRKEKLDQQRERKRAQERERQKQRQRERKQRLQDEMTERARIKRESGLENASVNSEARWSQSQAESHVDADSVARHRDSEISATWTEDSEAQDSNRI